MRRRVEAERTQRGLRIRLGHLGLEQRALHPANQTQAPRAVDAVLYRGARDGGLRACGAERDPVAIDVGHAGDRARVGPALHVRKEAPRGQGRRVQSEEAPRETAGAHAVNFQRVQRERQEARGNRHAECGHDDPARPARDARNVEGIHETPAG